MQKALTEAALHQLVNGDKAVRQTPESQVTPQVPAMTNRPLVQDMGRLAQKMCRILVDLAAVSKGINANTKVLTESMDRLRQGLKGMNDSVDQIKVD